MSGALSADRRREDVVRAHMPLVGHLVREMLARVPAHVNRDDLLSAGYAALVAAARGFDEERGVPFARFAAVRVRGAMLDELRGLDWASRSVRSRARRGEGAGEGQTGRVEAAREDLTAVRGGTPEPVEVAGYLGVAVGEVEAVSGPVARAVVLSLQ